MHCAGAVFQMQVLALSPESACNFWWMLLLLRWSEHGDKSDLVISELRTWRKLFLEEQMHCRKLLGKQPYFALLHLNKKTQTNLKMLSEHLPEGWCWDAKRELVSAGKDINLPLMWHFSMEEQNLKVNMMECPERNMHASREKHCPQQLV